MKKVLIITYYWPPSGGAGVQRWLKMIRYFPENGIEPIIVTVDPTKASYPLIDYSLEEEIPSHIQVHRTNTFEPLNLYTQIIPGARLPKPGFSDESNPGVMKKMARFIRGNFFVPDARIGWNRFAFLKCRKIISENKISAIVCTSPPHSSQLIGLKLKQKTGLPLIVDLRDPWTDIYYNPKLYRKKLAKRKDAQLEKQVLENADVIITVSESLKSLFKAKTPFIDPNKIIVIPNGFDLNDFLNEPASNSEDFIITYTGTMSDDYPIIPFTEAIQNTLVDHPEIKLKINLAGQISEGTMHHFKNSGLMKYVNLKGYVNHLEAVKLLQGSTVLLLIIPRVVNNEGILTGKLFEYLASHRPILCFGPVGGDAAKIIAECESGKVFDYNLPTDAASWLSELINLHKHKKSIKVGNEKVQQYTRQAQAKQISQIITRFG